MSEDSHNPSDVPFDVQQLCREFVAAMQGLDPDEVTDAVLSLFNRILPHMSEEYISLMRGEIATKFDQSLPFISQVLDLIDGHVALRGLI